MKNLNILKLEGDCDEFSAKYVFSAKYIWKSKKKPNGTRPKALISVFS